MAVFDIVPFQSFLLLFVHWFSDCLDYCSVGPFSEDSILCICAFTQAWQWFQDGSLSWFLLLTTPSFEAKYSTVFSYFPGHTFFHWVNQFNLRFFVGIVFGWSVCDFSRPQEGLSYRYSCLFLVNELPYDLVYISNKSTSILLIALYHSILFIWGGVPWIELRTWACQAGSYTTELNLPSIFCFWECF